MSDTPTFLTGTEFLLQELAAERAKVAELEGNLADAISDSVHNAEVARAAEAKVARLREALREAWDCVPLTADADACARIIEKALGMDANDE